LRDVLITLLSQVIAPSLPKARCVPSLFRSVCGSHELVQGTAFYSDSHMALQTLYFAEEAGVLRYSFCRTVNVTHPHSQIGNVLAMIKNKDPRVYEEGFKPFEGMTPGASLISDYIALHVSLYPRLQFTAPGCTGPSYTAVGCTALSAHCASRLRGTAFTRRCQT
jgi:hypothetical protein